MPQEEMGYLVELIVDLVYWGDIATVKNILVGFFIIGKPGAK